MGCSSQVILAGINSNEYFTINCEYGISMTEESKASIMKIDDVKELICLQQNLVTRHIKDIIDDCDEYVVNGDYKSIITIQQQTLEWLTLFQMTIHLSLVSNKEEIQAKKNIISYKDFYDQIKTMFTEKVILALSRCNASPINE